MGYSGSPLSFLLQEILQSVFRAEGLAVEREGEPRLRKA